MALALPASITDMLPVLQSLTPAQKKQVIDAMNVQSMNNDNINKHQNTENAAWQTYLNSRDATAVPEDFMTDRQQQNPQKRDLFL